MQRAVAIVGAFALVVAGIGAFAMSAQADPHPVQKDTVADDSTLANWSGEVGIENTTENVGRIWTDKTVQDGDITLSGGDAGSVTINKGSSDFLVGLSALSSMSNTMTTSTTPLDIVLVLDMSGSMSSEMSSEQQFVYNEVNARDVAESGVTEHDRFLGGSYFTQDEPGDYYVLIGDEYQPVLEQTHTERYESRRNGMQDFNIHDYWYLEDGTQVDPSTRQFYTRGTQTVTTTKIDALKEAVNEFIETTDQANASLPADGKHEVSIVKFASNSTDRVGNNTYDDHRYDPSTLNYSQVVTDFTSDATALENYVNNLEPAGATRADLGMEQAQRVIDGDRRYNLGGARNNSKKVVIFFTDGQPTSSDTWDAGVANDAIQTAREMKNDQNDPVTIYSIGVFEDANPSNTTDNSFNGYMHAVSSNYPNATGYIGTGYWEDYWSWVSPNMGDRAPDSDYYKAATSSDELSQIFQGISEDIGSGTGAPTQTKGENTETTSGYITITDQLGDYMQFDGMNSVVFAGQKFNQAGEPAPDTDPDYSGWTRYTFEGEANNEIYPNGNLDQLIIRVKKGTDLQTGDTVQVQIPASLIPTRYFDVDATAGTMSVTDAYPIRIFYGVSLKGGVADSIAAGAPMSGLSQADYDELATYVRSNQYTKDDGTAYASFLSNAWSGGSNGNTTSSFEPSSGNEFYYFTKPTTLYSDAACEHPVASVQDIRDGQTYYYKNTFWQFTDENADTDGTPYKAKETFTPFALTAAQARQLATGRDGDGNVCIPAGTRHMAMISELVENKAEGANKTSTATSVINPNWAGTGENETIDAALGNNGRLGIELPGTLSVTKNIEVPTGVDANQFANTDFPFQITMTDAANYTFKAQVKNADRTIANPASGEGYFDLAFNDQGVSTTVSLKPNQTLTIYGLGDGWTYSVAEVGEMPDGFKQTTPAGGAAVTGAIDQATPAVAEFTNTYSFNDDVTINGETDLSGTKTLVGRPWQDGDRFDFEIRVATGSKYANGTSVPRDAQPMPKTGTVQANGNVRISLTNDEAQGAASSKPVDFNFGDIEYGAPGTYNYIIREVSYNAGADGYVAGITYAQNRYFVQVVVTDNGQGELSAEATMRTLDAQDQVGQTVDLAAFTNTWSASDVSVMIEGDKNFSDSTRPGVTTAAQDQFFFRITAEDGGPLPVPDASNDVVRDEGANYIVVTTLPAGMVQFGNAAFNDEMVGDTYTYTIEEVVKQDDQYVSVKEAIEPVDGAYVLNGMTYDATEWTLAVTVTADGSQLKATPSYTGGTPQDGSFVFTNSYDPADATLTGDAAIHGTKTLTGRDMTGDEHFTFTLKGEDPATTTAMTDGTITFGGQSQAEYTKSVSGADKGTPEGFNFGDMVINKDGTYTFNLSETGYMDGGTTYAGAQLDSPINGIAFDRHVCTVTVTVTDEGGQLTGKVEYNTENGGSAFTNTYTANETYGADVNLTVGKTLTGRNMKQGEFTFEITATGENADAAQANLDAANIASTFRNPQAAYDGTESTWTIFENLAFNQDDAGKTFTYQVKEQIPAEEDRAGVTYDGSVYEVAIQVVDDADGTMHTVTTVTRDGEPVGTFDSSNGNVTPKLAFANSYHGAPVTVDPETDTRLQFNKVVTGRDWLERDNFEFSIKKVSFNGATDENALAVMPDPEQATVTLGGAAQAGTKAGERVPFDFGTMTFTEAGRYVYRVDETNTGNDGQGLTYDEHTVDIVIVIRDNNEGNLVVDAIYAQGGASTTFTNTYASGVNYPEAAASLSVQKTLKGHAMTDGQFEFTVTPDDEASAKKVDLWQDDAIQTATGDWDAAADGQATEVLVNWDLTFTQADSGNTYTYTFAEVVPENAPAGYSYDGTTYTVAITPRDNQDGTMSVTTVVTKKTAEGESTETTYTYSANDAKDDIVLPFVNTYGSDATTDDVAADVDATKTLTGRNMTEGEFNFEIVTRDADPDDGAEFTSTTVATGTNAAANDGAAGAVTFTDGDGDAMTYTIAKLDQAVANGYATKSVGDNGNATWTLNYTAQELTDSLPAKVTAVEDAKSFDFTVTVTDDGAGELTAKVNLPQGGIAFKNTYKPDDVTVGAGGDAQITVQKTFTGRANNAWLESDSFVFTIAADEQTPDAPLPADNTVVISSEDNPENGIATNIFGNITYTKAHLDGAMSKEFVYTITETSPADSGSGITKDTHTATVTVRVTDDGTGKLKAEVTYDNNDAKTEADQQVDNAAAFTNTYNAGSGMLDGSTYLKASKTLTGRDWQEGEQVDLVLTGAAGSPAPDGATETADGWAYSLTIDGTGKADGDVIAANFLNIEYSADDLDGAASKTFEYTISEDEASHTIEGGTEADNAQIHQGMDYSQASYIVRVTVRDNNQGGLTVESTMVQMLDDDGNLVNDEEGTVVDVAAFTNRFSADTKSIPLSATKNYTDATGGHPITSNMFTFMVTPAGDEAADAPMDENRVADGTAGADRYITAGVQVEAGKTPTASFGTARFQFDGQNHTFYYEVVEVLNVDGTWTPVADAITPNEDGALVKDGVTYDPTVYTVKVEVTYDDQADTPTSSAEMTIYKGSYAEVSAADADALDAMKVDGITFENSYGTGGTTVDTGDAQTTANFTKVIDGRDWLASDSFQFTITPNGDAPAFDGADPDTKAKTVNVTADNPVVDKTTGIDGTETEVNGRSFNFGSVTFTDADMTGATMVDGKLTKTFTYTVTEVEPADGYKIPGMTYDTIHKATLTITVVDNGDGTMTATPQVSNDVFLNSYNTSVDGTAFGGFQITKTLTGHAMTAGQFEFTVTPVDGTGTTAADAAAKLGITDDNGTVASPAADDGQTVTVDTFDLADGMTFTQDDADKTFVYKVTETKKGGDGYTNDDATYRVEIAVAHDATTATLTVTTTVYKGGEQVDQTVVTNATAERATATVSFNNSYFATTDPDEGGTSATVSTTKTLEGRPLEDGEFTFQVAYAGGDKAVVKDGVTNTADGTVDFGSFDYTTETLADMVAKDYATKSVDEKTGNATWTIQYTASEVTDGLADAGVTPEKASFTFTITVVDKGGGTLTATAKLPEDHGFKNTYTSTGEGGLPVTVTPAGTKVIDAEDGLTPNLDELAGKFTFTLSSNDPNAPMPAAGGEVATNDAQGNVTFGTIEFSLDNLNKALDAQAGTDEGIDTQEVGGTPREYTFTYQVTESGGVDYVQNDETTVREFSYTVHDDGKGNLTVTREPEAGALFTFTNTYTVEPELSSPTGAGQLTITKTLTGRDMVADEFTFVLTAAGGTQYKGTNAAAADGKPGAVTFDAITFTKPGTYQYTLAEQLGAGNVGVDYDTDTYTVTADVKDNGQGGLEVTWSINGTQDKTVAFENTYEAKPASMSFGASKVLTGRDLEDGEFSFQVTDETGEALYANGTNDAAGTVNFDPITFNQAGTYHLWISEVLPEDDDAETEGIQSENVTYDETRYELVVTVEDNGTGNLQVTNVEEVDGTPVFENVYTEPVEPVLPGGDSLEQTGDTMPLAVGTVAVAGVALVAGGLVMRRKHGE